MKTCTKCGVEKSVDQFYAKKGSKDCMHAWCKPCINERSKQHYQDNKVEITKHHKTYDQINKVAVAGRAKTYQQANKVAIAEYKKVYHQANKVAIAERCKAYNQANKVAIAAKAKTYRQSGKVGLAERNKTWRQANKVKLAEKRKAYNQANKVEIADKKKIYSQANPEKYRANNANRRARKRAATGKHSSSDIKALFVLQQGLCICCRVSIKDGYQVDHVYALARGGSNDKHNLQLLCQPCNQQKSAKDPIVFMQSKGFLI